MHPGFYAAQTPDRLALIMATSGVTMTYAELDRRINRAAHLLASFGLRPGDHIAFQVANRPEFFELVWAAHLSGLWYTPLSTRLGPEETAYIVNDCAAKVLVVSADIGSTLSGVGIDPARAGRSLCHRRRRAGMGFVGGCRRGAADDGTGGADRGRRPAVLVGHDRAAQGRRARDRCGRCARPVRRRHVAVPAQCSASTRTRSTSRPAPLYHAAPLRFTRAVHRLGGTVIQMERFDAEQYLRLVERHRVTASQLVPTMFVRMLKLTREVRPSTTCRRCEPSSTPPPRARSRSSSR